MSRSTTINTIQDIMRKDAGADGVAQRRGQMDWLLFLKIRDDQDAELGFTDDDCESPLLEVLHWINGTANLEGSTGDALVDFGNAELFGTLENLTSTGHGNTPAWLHRAEHHRGCLHQNHVFRSSLVHSMTDEHYLMLYLNSPVSRDYFARSSKQSPNLTSINMTQLLSTAIPLPPLAEQYCIVAKANELLALYDQLEAAITSRDDTASRYAEAVVQQLSAA